MPRVPDPFQGVSLTDATPTPTPGRDQRLFASTSPLPALHESAAGEQAAAVEPKNLGTYESSSVTSYGLTKLGSKETRKVGNKVPRKEGVEGDATHVTEGPFDIANRADRQANFMFTDGELDALDDLKRDAKRRHGLPTTKQDLVRLAVIDLLNDYEAYGEESRIIQRLRNQRRA